MAIARLFGTKSAIKAMDYLTEQVKERAGEVGEHPSHNPTRGTDAGEVEGVATFDERAQGPTTTRRWSTPTPRPNTCDGNPHPDCMDNLDCSCHAGCSHRLRSREKAGLAGLKANAPGFLARADEGETQSSWEKKGQGKAWKWAKSVGTNPIRPETTCEAVSFGNASSTRPNALVNPEDANVVYPGIHERMEGTVRGMEEASETLPMHSLRLCDTRNLHQEKGLVLSAKRGALVSAFMGVDISKVQVVGKWGD